MSDLKPPRLNASEREVLVALLQYQRDSVIRKVHGLEERATWSPVQSGTNALWLLHHLATAERSWILERFDAQASPSDEGAPSNLDGAVERYRATSRAVDQVIAAHDLNELCRGDVGEPPVNLRWIVAHLLEETARHAGHLDIICELIDGRAGR